jgi:acyl-CoA synthetase (AMP-forming)/AMP-acid ligase II
VPDDAAGSLLVAHVSAKDGVAPRDISQFCADRIPKYMVPDRVDMLGDLPKTATAKIDRAGLARRATELAG